MSNRKLDTYESITLWYHAEDPECNFARVYIAVKSVKLDTHLTVEYRDGRREMAKLMLKLGKMPEVRHYDGFTVYDLHGFLD